MSFGCLIGKMIPRTAACLLFVALMGAVSARAQERDNSAPSVTPTASDGVVLPARVQLVAPAQRNRPLALPALYGSFVTFQVLDIVSTHKARSAGAQEMNPVVGG